MIIIRWFTHGVAPPRWQRRHCLSRSPHVAAGIRLESWRGGAAAEGGACPAARQHSTLLACLLSPRAMLLGRVVCRNQRTLLKAAATLRVCPCAAPSNAQAKDRAARVEQWKAEAAAAASAASAASAAPSAAAAASSSTGAPVAQDEDPSVVSHRSSVGRPHLPFSCCPGACGLRAARRCVPLIDSGMFCLMCCSTPQVAESSGNGKKPLWAQVPGLA